MLANLNDVLIETDGLEGRPLRDFSTSAHGVSVYFRNLEAALCAHIDQADYVFGCVAWLTNERVLAALAKKRGVALVVQKEDFLRPDSEPAADWKARLAAGYSKLKPLERSCFDAPLCSMSVCGDPIIESVRCVGISERGQRTTPRAHHKFVVFAKALAKRRDAFDRWRLTSVWTGSFNFTQNGTNSLENAISLRTPQIVRAYYNEFLQVAALSEPLDWSQPYVDPEWRIGT